MNIRQATPADVELAARREPPGADIATRHFARQQRGEAVYLVARDREEILGGELLIIDGNAAGIPEARLPLLRHLHVEPAYRNRGVGAALMAAAEEVARERGFTRVSLIVGVDNPRARQLYLRLGYVPTGEQQTQTYTYVDQDGVERQATETGDVMVKAL
ncbi:GNAT family N-acetyltransferase [Bogoriella caseilytica]|uniref:Ribosomal protein S18 acetylase RimI-like enzyme n=1 Tax=Bogoriella caseilytica TaxID=56055 RepID=A0A3N2BFX0_9MICO|nr:GNAT family N-acetyltransferase [Bogoriella caseilytica]ROR74156.1 ribosomal protein S18 acetylase RimI-like enzyme [Bogoriella caseilytica]